MCLTGFAGFGLKAGDKTFEVGNGALLFFEGLLLLGESFGTLVFKVAVVTGVEGQCGVGQLDNMGGGGIQKLAIMRNQ